MRSRWALDVQHEPSCLRGRPIGRGRAQAPEMGVVILIFPICFDVITMPVALMRDLIVLD